MPSIGSAAFYTLGLLLGEMRTTDPTSLELALAGGITFLAYEILARPGHARRNDPLPGPVPVEPPTAETVVTEHRRVA